MQPKYKIAVVDSIPYIVIFIVIGLTVYLNALIVQDSITLFVAEIIGYSLVTVIIGFEIYSLILLKVKEVEIAIKNKKIEERDEKIEALEAELNRQKGLG